MKEEITVLRKKKAATKWSNNENTLVTKDGDWQQQIIEIIRYISENSLPYILVLSTKI
jgi:hypothetical protein